MGWLPLAKLALDFLGGSLTANPIQEIIQRLGRTAIYFLVAVLACTPLNTLFGWQAVLQRRRSLGLYAFMYASLHFLVFAGLDYGSNIKLITEAIFEKPFALMGAIGFLMLLPLAITSSRWWIKVLGKGWQNLHRLVYLASTILIIHFAWARKGNLTMLRGDIQQPLTLGLIVVVLLVLRIPPVKSWLEQLRHKIALRHRQSPSPKSNLS